jgi:hypothetical protein
VHQGDVHRHRHRQRQRPLIRSRGTGARVGKGGEYAETRIVKFHWHGVVYGAGHCESGLFTGSCNNRELTRRLSNLYRRQGVLETSP